MAYSSFTLDTVQEAFHLEVIDTARVFADIEPMAPSDFFTTLLERHVPLAIAIGTEKAKSELIVAGVLAELREQLDRRISFFSGIDFNVERASDLVGVCDFLVSLSPRQSSLKAPVIVLVEAKREDLIGGLGQCTAEMVAAQRFNAEKGNDIPRIYGATTSGVEWLFLKLEGQKLYIDLGGYTIERCDRILGILASMVAQTA